MSTRIEEISSSKGTIMLKHTASSILAFSGVVLACTEARAQATQAPIFLAEIERFDLAPGCADEHCQATLVAAGEKIILPANLLVDLPANRLSAKHVFDQAPAACRAKGESGLAAKDTCTGGHGGFVTLAANRTRCGEVIAGDVFIQKGLTAINGDVTFINYKEGWFRLNGELGNATAGTMVRFNDPSATHSIQAGAGCAGGPNCSPDARFTGDPVNYTMSFSSGYPLCIPSSIVAVAGVAGAARVKGANPATGAGDPFCPLTNRPATAIDPVAADSRRFAPLKTGDNVFVNGNIETVGGVSFLSAHAVIVNIGLMTRDDPSQPDYLQITETVWDMPSFGRNRARFRALGQGTLPASSPTRAGNDLDLFALRVDPVDGTSLVDPIGSTFNNPGTNGLGSRPTGVNIWRLTYDVTFPPLAVKPNQPCANLLNAGLLVGRAAEKCAGGGTIEENFSVLSPVSREVFARTRHKRAAILAAARGGPPVPQTLDILGKPANQGEYTRPLGISMGGIEPPPAVEFDLNLGPQPFVFEGLPWLLDRRVGPTGCSAAGCEPLDTFAIGSLAAAPFPFSGRTPDEVVTGLTGGPTVVPVPGRPATFFGLDDDGNLVTDVLPVPADAQCAPGLVVRSFKADGDGAANGGGASGGCTASGGGGPRGGYGALLAVAGALASVLWRRRHLASPDEKGRS
jgi:MYXO-CTERM domain-containing protein